MDARSLLQNVRIMPVVTIEDPERAVPLAETLLAAGIGAVEVTLRSAGALAALARITESNCGILAGAGSIRRPEQLHDARRAGARFAVSPGSTDALLDSAAALALPFVPGAVTASEMMRLLERGYTLQKFFPAEACGGLRALQGLAAPLPELRFFPTGGIDATLAAAYLAFPSVACVGGSWFVPAAALATGDFQAISRLARTAATL